jgi:hypothetical protein
VNTLCGGLVNQNQFDALVSFAYNLGVGALGQSTLLMFLKEGKHAEAADQFLRWVNAGGVVLEGLVSRRKEERALFLTPVNDVPKPSVDDRVTWLELHRLEENGVVRTGCVGYAGAEPLVTWDGTDKGSLLQFVQRFENANAVLVAGADKPWPTLVKPPQPVERYLKLQRTGTKEEKGCEVLLLTLEGTHHAWYVRSGQPHAQVFQKGGPENVPGSMMPLPGGIYSVGDIQWAKKDDYQASLGAGLGPMFVPVEPQFQTRRSAFGIHADTGAYGTAGCIGVRSTDDLKRLVRALREYDPKRLVVDWS